MSCVAKAMTIMHGSLFFYNGHILCTRSNINFLQPFFIGSDGDEYSKNGKKTVETMTLRKEGRRYIFSFDFKGTKQY